MEEVSRKEYGTVLQMRQQGWTVSMVTILKISIHTPRNNFLQYDRNKTGWWGTGKTVSTNSSLKNNGRKILWGDKNKKRGIALHLGKEKESLSLPSKPGGRGKQIWGEQVILRITLTSLYKKKQVTGSPSHSNQTRKRKGIQFGKEEVKLSLFADDMIWKIPKDVTKILLELINDLSRIQMNFAGYKINI